MHGSCFSLQLDAIKQAQCDKICAQLEHASSTDTRVINLWSGLCADCGRFMNSLYEQARDIVAKELNAPCDEYAVIFTGSGATAGLDKLTRALLDKHKVTLAAAAKGKALPPVVFVGPHEHHSNEVLWRERSCIVKVDCPGLYTPAQTVDPHANSHAGTVDFPL